jgi:hypothetical protein
MDIMEPQHAGHGEESLLIRELAEDGQDSDKWNKFSRGVVSDDWCIAIDCLNYPYHEDCISAYAFFQLWQ